MCDISKYPQTMSSLIEYFALACLYKGIYLHMGLTDPTSLATMKPTDVDETQSSASAPGRPSR